MIVEPYNAILHLSQLIKHADISFTLENSKIYRLCQERLRVERPSFKNLNHMIAQVISSLTISLRRFSDFNVDINEYATNLVPFQKRHFMLTSLSPIKSIEDEPAPLELNQMTRDAFSYENTLADCKMKENDKQMACCLVYRGDVNHMEAKQAIAEFKKDRTINLVDWCPDGFLLGINKHGPGNNIIKT